MQEKLRHSTIAILILLMGAAAGCSRTAPARFYLLSDLPAAGIDVPSIPAGSCFTLGIGPIEIPDYLDRPQLVTQVSPNEMQLGDFDQWAEPLGKMVMRTLADNLAALLCVENVVFYPAESAEVDHQIIVTVTRFHALQDGTVTLSAQWQVTEGGRGNVVARKRATIRESAGDQGYAALVAAQSRALAQLSREIAEAVSLASKCPQASKESRGVAFAP